MQKKDTDNNNEQKQVILLQVLFRLGDNLWVRLFLNNQFYNFYQFFDSLGYTKIKDSDYFRIGGCGMDMIFHTNYTIMHDLRRLGFINKEECDTLAQATPHIV